MNGVDGQAVNFDPGGIERSSELVAERDSLDTNDVGSFSRFATEATEISGVSLLARLGDSQAFDVFRHIIKRSLPGSWAHECAGERCSAPSRPPPAASAPRRSTDNPNFQGVTLDFLC